MNFVLVLPDAVFEITGDSNVERAGAAGYDVGVVALGDGECI
jgi:hypothetical protein